MGASPAPPLRGRRPEREEIERALTRIRGGESAVLVLRGEAGIGKTSLLNYCADQATDCHVTRIFGVQSELELPYAALHQLCVPLLDSVDSLPEPQAHALKVAFGLETGSRPDRFVVGLGVLSMLAAIATERPLVCLVDDAQWLDEASCQILGFVGRRLLAESILLLFTVREPVDESLLAGLPDLAIAGLADADARELLDAAVPGQLDMQIQDRIVAETRGNPLALLEVSRAMSKAELLGGFALPLTATRPGQLQDHYVQRIQALPGPTRQLMLLAAADATGDATLVWRAAHTLDLGPDAAAPAEAEQLIEISSRVSFRHPLVRSAAYAAGSDDDRRNVHLALAAATAPEADPERRIWHLATAANQADDDVAAELERFAERFEGRGGLPAAAAFLHRSAALTTDPGRRADRALDAAHAYLHAGDFDTALRLLAEAQADATDELRRARVDLLRGQLHRAARSGSEAPVLLLQAAQRLEPLDARLSRDTYLDAWSAALVAGALAPAGGQLLEVSVAAQGAPPAPDGQTPGDSLLEGLTLLITLGSASAEPSLRRAVDSFLGDQVSTDQWLHWGVLATNAALALWDFECWVTMSTRHVELARSSGALAPLANAINVHRVVAIWGGDFEAASALSFEEDTVKEVTGTQRASYGSVLLAAYQGRPAEAEPLFESIALDARKRGEGLGILMVNRATAILHNGLGHYAAALTAAEAGAEGDFGPFTALVLPEVIEAAARSGEDARAAAALTRLAAYVGVSGTDWAGGLLARSQALLSEGDVADKLYLEAVERFDRAGIQPELARTRLLYGEWLRRERRRVDAREHLRAAYDAFETMGAEGFAERARHELLATGEKVRKRQVGPLSDLTPQEEHIARLARDGKTNPEIGAELFISARTVEWHLRKVFSKLDIASRRELVDALPARGAVHGS